METCPKCGGRVEEQWSAVDEWGVWYECAQCRSRFHAVRKDQALFRSPLYLEWLYRL